MDFLPVVICFFVGLALAQIVIPFIQRWDAARTSRKSRERSFHQTNKAPISRLGGLAIAGAFAMVAVLAWFFATEGDRSGWLALVMVGSSLAMFGVGFWDDLKALGARKKFALQILIAALAYLGGIEINTFHVPVLGRDVALGSWAGPVTVFWLVALTNLINLIDGIDGLAAGVGFMLMSLLTVVGVRSGGLAFTVLCATGLAGALLGFLRFNFPPAKIYMGDGGAYFIGFLIGLLTVMNSQKGTIIAALIAPLFALALPIIDVATAILRRGMQGLPIFRADRKHLHHRLLAKGLSRRKAVVMMYVVCLMCLACAFAVFCLKGVWLPFIFGAFCLILLLAGHRIDFGRDYLALGRALGNSIDLRKESRYALPLVRWLELEAERAMTVDELGDGFEFLCRKFRFSAVRVQTGIEKSWNFSNSHQEAHNGAKIDDRSDGSRNFGGEQETKLAARDAGAPSEEQRLRYDLPGSESACVEFVAGTVMGRASFELLSELAAEAWFKALQRWQQLHPIEVQSEEATGVQSAECKVQS
jgi:UDP-GlcNAc:undecaprenyl-phosphate GlcNAc-1-phosphate transferase